jgi:plasmid stability protein
MAVQTLTLKVPDPIYTRLKQRAQQMNRTVEDELLDVLATAVPVEEELPADLAEALTPLTLLDDADLERAARSQLATEVAAQLEELHLKRQREGLTEAESQTLAALVRQYERALLVRAEAALLLRKRGHDVSALASAQ